MDSPDGVTESVERERCKIRVEGGREQVTLMGERKTKKEKEKEIEGKGEEGG